MTDVQIRVVYHWEENSWWADSPDVAGFTAVGETLEEVRSLAKDGVAFHLDSAADMDLRESYEDGGPVRVLRVSVPSARLWDSLKAGPTPDDSRLTGTPKSVRNTPMFVRA